MDGKTKFSWGKFGQRLADTALALAGVACLGLGVSSLWRGNVAAAGTGLTAGLVLLLAASVERFEVLKGLGIEARTRKLDEAITQATATLEQLRELAEMSSESLVSLNSKMGRWDSHPPAPEAYEVVQRVRRNLKNLGSSDEAIRKAMAPWVHTLSFDLASDLLTEILHPWRLLLQHWDQKIQSYPQPIAAGDPAFQALIDQRNHFGMFEGNYVGGGVHEWQPGTHSQRLRNIVESVPLLDEADRQRLRDVIAPWLPRLDYLARNYDLIDKEEWFAKLKH